MTALPKQKWRRVSGTKGVTYVCARCGSTSVVRAADASWSVEHQRWETDRVLDEAFCRSCVESTDLTERELP